MDSCRVITVPVRIAPAKNHETSLCTFSIDFLLNTTIKFTHDNPVRIKMCYKTYSYVRHISVSFTGSAYMYNIWPKMVAVVSLTNAEMNV